MKKSALAAGLLFSAALFARAAAAPAPAIIDTDPAAVSAAADGGLRPVVGVENIQVFRANRAHPAIGAAPGNTYQHQPMLAWWRGRFYLDFLSGPVDENQPPCSTLLTTSADGVHWTAPEILFPAYRLPDGNFTIMHQRMSFYVAPDGRLLATGFHGRLPEANNGHGVGRVVREIKPDGGFGPIYFIRYDRQNGWNESNTPYPLYTASPDAGFVAACRALLADKLATAQWWEEDRSTDGFYRITGKALCIYHRPDGQTVEISKEAMTAISADHGQSWTRTGPAENLPRNASKYWVQRTSDGRYALVFNPTDRWRWPLAVLTSADGAHFAHLLDVHGEVPDQRFPGAYKNLGPQYVRGIAEGNGTPPDGALWVAYSVNKEDIWVSRIPVPITGVASGPVHDDFAATPAGQMPPGWNIYRPLWAPVSVIEAGPPAGHALELRDEDPYDYARAVRVFPACHSAVISFKFLARQTNARFDIDVEGAHGERPVRLSLTPQGRIEVCHEDIWIDAGPYAANRWTRCELDINPGNHTDTFTVRIDGADALPRAAVFAEPSADIERLSFRTGKYRRLGCGGHELPGADEKAPLRVFLLDDVSIVPRA